MLNKQLSYRLSRGDYEFRVPLLKQFFYSFERSLGNFFFKRYPPNLDGLRLLNLGCGPVTYDNWINADDYAFKRSIREKRFAPDWRLDITQSWKCEDNYWDGIFTQHVLEHVTYSKAIFVLQECFRTLKPDCWIRISVPSVKVYIDYYEGRIKNDYFEQFPNKALAISFLTQMHLHRSTWDGELMTQLLLDLGFEDAKEVPFGEGTDKRLIKDQDVKKAESLYVEARKQK